MEIHNVPFFVKQSFSLILAAGTVFCFFPFYMGELASCFWSWTYFLNTRRRQAWQSKWVACKTLVVFAFEMLCPKKTENNMAFHGNKRLMIAQNVKKQCCLLCMKTWQWQLMLLNERVSQNGKTAFPKNTNWSSRNSNSSVSQFWVAPAARILKTRVPWIGHLETQLSENLFDLGQIYSI